MANQIKLEANKTYATEANAVKAVEKKYGNNNQLRFFVFKTENNRYFPVFLGETALQQGVHFNFNVAG